MVAIRASAPAARAPGRRDRGDNTDAGAQAEAAGRRGSGRCLNSSWSRPNLPSVVLDSLSGSNGARTGSCGSAKAAARGIRACAVNAAGSPVSKVAKGMGRHSSLASGGKRRGEKAGSSWDQRDGGAKSTRTSVRSDNILEAAFRGHLPNKH